MNGRIYDPLLGRFLSADLVVQFPGNLQSYNRYSYVENNPLTRIDPTGWYSILGLEFTDGGGVSGFFKDVADYNKAAAMGAVGDNMVEGYKSGTEHMAAGITEIGNAKGGLDATIGGLHMVAAVGTAVGVVMDVTLGGKAEKMAVQGAEKLATKAETAVVRAVEKAEGKAATIEKRVEGVTAGADSRIKPNPAGSKGAPDHVKATNSETDRLTKKYADNPDVEIRSNKSVKDVDPSLTRKPDVAVVDTKQNKILEVSEVARTNKDGSLVPRERAKLPEYQKRDIPTNVIKLPKKANWNE